MTMPAVYVASPSDVRTAVGRIRDRVRDLAEPRMYQTAVLLTLLGRSNGATCWQSWDSPPPSSARRFRKADLIDAMWQLFGTDAPALLRAGSPVAQGMDNPTRVLLDPFYGANGPLTLVRRGPIAPHQTRNSAKLTLEDPSWIWSAPSASSSSEVRLAEYNPVNTFNQQNGIRCALPVTTALAANPNDPGAVYAVPRPDCPNYQQKPDHEPRCALNGEVCGGQGDGAGRAVTKPRLMAPPITNYPSHLVLPGTIEALVAQARRGDRKLPLGNDLSLLANWCHTSGTGTQDASRLAGLLGADGIRLLTSPT
jgi:hypothetical protein